MIQTRFPKCSKCSNPIDPNKDKFRVVNLEEAKYGRAPVYAHENCPATVRVDQERFEATVAGLAAGDTESTRDGSKGV